jgi:hypothetical protein
VVLGKKETQSGAVLDLKDVVIPNTIMMFPEPARQNSIGRIKANEPKKTE